MTDPLPSLNYENACDARPNGLGVAGFVVSLLGLLSCGLIAPIGLILSALAMRRLPRGLAIAGLVLGILGTLELAVVATGVGFTIHTASVFTKLYVTTFSTMQTSHDRIQRYCDTHGDIMPPDADGNVLISGDRDAWGRGLRYHKIGPRDFEIRSAGPDGMFDNLDDQRMEYGGMASSLPSALTEPGPER